MFSFRTFTSNRCARENDFNDMDVTAACLLLSSKAFIVRDRETNIFFNNIFCAIWCY
ncbi:hypothetical protein BgiMline_006367, partial [Biomphalaria glabrata]